MCCLKQVSCLHLEIFIIFGVSTALGDMTEFRKKVLKRRFIFLLGKNIILRGGMGNLFFEMLLILHIGSVG